MKPTEVHVVTGAFGYSGRYIARRLMGAGVLVRTLTSAPQRANPFGAGVEAHPYSFGDPARLVDALRGASVLYNTYWIRFNHAKFKQADAVENTLALFDAAREAGVRRVVHVSITNPSEDSPLERALVESGLPHAILRPTVLFGDEDMLMNNIAWILRRFPVFGVFGDGEYRLQPMFVDDLAELAVREGGGTQDRTIDAVGPETFTYRELVRRIGDIIGRPRPVVSVPPAVGHLVGVVMGKLLGDVVVTRAEIAGLMGNLLCTDSTPAGRTRLTDWARAHADTLGVRYAGELARRTDQPVRGIGVSRAASRMARAWLPKRVARRTGVTRTQPPWPRPDGRGRRPRRFPPRLRTDSAAPARASGFGSYAATGASRAAVGGELRGGGRGPAPAASAGGPETIGKGVSVLRGRLRGLRREGPPDRAGRYRTSHAPSYPAQCC